MEKNINSLFSIFDMQKNFAKTSSDFSVKNITSKLLHLLDVFKKYEKELASYINKEYDKPFLDIYKSDILLIKKEIIYFIKNIRKFRKANHLKSISGQFINTKNKVIFKPYGCCLILLNELFPLSKTFIPIIGALACGNTLFIKLPNYNNNLNKIIKTIIKEVFNDNFVYFINENMPESEMKNIWDFNFDLVFYSGSSSNSKSVIRAFSLRNTKLILDINSKCPIIVDETADLLKVAKQIVWSKMFNAGQTSCSPYYLIIHESIIKAFLTNLKMEYEKQFPKINKWKKITKLDSLKTFQNVTSLLEKSLLKNRILFGGDINEEERKIELTLLSVDDLKSPFLTTDIESPILPVVVFNSFSDIHGIVKHNDTPSSIYLFSKNKKRIKTLLNDLESRYFHINQITMPFIKKYWFGGIKNSGTHLYSKEQSIYIFSYKKIIIKNTKGDNSKFKSFNRKENKMKEFYSYQ